MTFADILLPFEKMRTSYCQSLYKKFCSRSRDCLDHTRTIDILLVLSECRFRNRLYHFGRKFARDG